MNVEALQDRLVVWVEEAVALRKKLPALDVGDGPSAIHEQLVKARAVLDRVEEITVSLIRLKGRTHAAVVAGKHLVKEAEDRAYTSRHVGFDQYATGREREAWAGSQTINERAELMGYEKLDIDVGMTLDAVKTIRWGIDGYRRDADARLRLMTFERQLER